MVRNALLPMAACLAFASACQNGGDLYFDCENPDCVDKKPDDEKRSSEEQQCLENGGQWNGTHCAVPVDPIEPPSASELCLASHGHWSAATESCNCEIVRAGCAAP